MQPQNYQVNLKYAEMLYSTRRDRLDDLLSARKYFSHAALLREDTQQPCVRALLGLIKTCRTIAKLAKKEDPINREIFTSAQEQLMAAYAARASDKMKSALQGMASMRPLEETQAAM